MAIRFAVLFLMPVFTAGTAAERGFLDELTCGLVGHWDNVAQATEDIASGVAENDRHPRRAMTYVPIANPNIDGQLFAILNYTERGFAGPLERISLHRFRQAEDGDRIVHEFLFFEDPDSRAGLESDLSPLTNITPNDVRINPNCAMYWRRRADHFEGSTQAGRCVTDSFTEKPILVEGHGELRVDRLVRHDRNFTLTGEPMPIPGGASPEKFDRVAGPGVDADGPAASIAGVAALLDCSPDD